MKRTPEERKALIELMASQSNISQNVTVAPDDVLPDQIEFVPPSALKKQMRVMEAMIDDMRGRIKRLEYEVRVGHRSTQPYPETFTWSGQAQAHTNSGVNAGHGSTSASSLGMQQSTSSAGLTAQNLQAAQQPLSQLQIKNAMYVPPVKKKKHGFF